MDSYDRLNIKLSKNILNSSQAITRNPFNLSVLTGRIKFHFLVFYDIFTWEIIDSFVQIVHRNINLSKFNLNQNDIPGKKFFP